MANKQQHIDQVKGIPIGNRGESEGKERTMNLSQLPSVLKRSLEDWESEMRQKTNDKYFDYLEELSTLTGIARSTIRDYITETDHSAKFPPVNKLIQICLIINNSRPLEFVKDYYDYMVNK